MYRQRAEIAKYSEVNIITSNHFKLSDSVIPPPSLTISNDSNHAKKNHIVLKEAQRKPIFLFFWTFGASVKLCLNLFQYNHYRSWTERFADGNTIYSLEYS